MDRLPLFVFGTLRRGQRNHHYLADTYERMLAARLHGYARTAALMIAPRRESVVEGELYFIKPALYDQTLRHCDDLEGIAPGQTRGESYTRAKVVVETAEGPAEAWAYVASSK